MSAPQVTLAFADHWYQQQRDSFMEVYKTLHMIKGPERFIHLCAVTYAVRIAADLMNRQFVDLVNQEDEEYGIEITNYGERLIEEFTAILPKEEELKIMEDAWREGRDPEEVRARSLKNKERHETGP